MQEVHDSHFVTSKIALFSHDKLRVLVTHIRINKPDEGYGLPGGHIDGDESPKQAMSREIQEELGILFSDFIEVDSFRHQSGKVVIGFTGIAPDGISLQCPNPDDEVGEWKTREEFEALDTGAYREFVLKHWPRWDEDSTRHFLAVFFLSFMWGTFGVDRFYLGKIGTGLLKLISFGGFGIWVIVDLVLIMSGSMRDKHGKLLREAEQYKKFAAKTVLVFAIVLGLVTLVTGGVFIFIVYQIMTSLVSGGMDGMTNILPPGFAPPDMSQYEQNL